MNYKKRNLFSLRFFLPFLIVILCIALFSIVFFIRALHPKNNFSMKPTQSIEETTPKINILFNDDTSFIKFSPFIVQELQKAKTEIQLALYSINNKEILAEIEKAAKRGVSVSLVLDIHKKDAYELLLSDFPKNVRISYAGEGKTNALEANFMHHKFALIDKKTVLFGSFNWTEIQEKNDPSFLMTSTDPLLIQEFSKEFERLIQGSFGVKKFTNISYQPHPLLITTPNGFFDLWWGPGTKEISVKNKIIELIRSAKTSIDISSRDLTDKEIEDALIKKINEGKIHTTILVDDYALFQNGSIFSSLIKKQKNTPENITIITDIARSLEEKNNTLKAKEINSYLHQHMLIIDKSVALLGTNNWTGRGFYENDEMTIITSLPSLLKEINASFLYHENILKESSHLGIITTKDDIKKITEIEKKNISLFFVCFYEQNDTPTIFEIKNTTNEILLHTEKCEEKSGFLIQLNKKSGTIETAATFLGN